MALTPSSSLSATPSSSLTRRRLVAGAAWSAPAVFVATAAPALSVSLRKDPGINGWAQTRSSLTSAGQGKRTWTSQSGHSNRWGTPVRGNPSTQPDGLVYTPCTWTYSGMTDASQQGAGPAETLTFQRRAGSLGSYTGTGRSAGARTAQTEIVEGSGTDDAQGATAPDTEDQKDAQAIEVTAVL